MVKKENILIGLLLLLCLWIYTFYRPQTIFINEIWDNIGLNDLFLLWKKQLSIHVPLPHWMIYNLPEALWIFCLSISAKSVYIPWKTRKLSLYSFPIIYAIALEAFQYLHITNGTFDFWDIFASLIAWLIAIWIPLGLRKEKSNLLKASKDAWRWYVVFAIVLLAHFSGD